jgi:hypothetical protein
VKSLLKDRRPSPALIVACLALFISLSGVSYGVATGFIDSREIKNNEVRSLDIRNNEIRTRDLRNNEVRGIDIRNSTIQSRDIAVNGVQGVDVKEDTLAKVPSAAAADTAGSAGSVSTLKIIPRTVVPDDGEVTLATHGPLTLSGRCFETAGNTTAQLRVTTTEDNSAAGGASTDYPDVDAATSPQVITAVQDPSAGGMRNVGNGAVFASAPSGSGFTGVVAVYADSAGPNCTFHGHLALQG